MSFCGADDVMDRYWSWLWQQVQQLASQEPNSKAALARYSKLVLGQETDIALCKHSRYLSVQNR